MKEAVAFLVGFGLWFLVTLAIGIWLEKPSHAVMAALAPYRAVGVILWLVGFGVVAVWFLLGLGFGEYCADHLVMLSWWIAWIVATGVAVWFVGSMVIDLVRPSRPTSGPKEGSESDGV